MNYKIVLCEDELIIRLDLETALKKYGLNIYAHFTTAEEALVFIKENKPNLVITNVHLKGKISGIQFAQMLVEHFMMRVILITGESGECLPLNNKFILEIKKPFSTEEIISKINSFRKAPPSF